MPSSSFAWLGEVERVPSENGKAAVQASFSRLWRAFMTARVVIAIALLGLQTLAHAMDNLSGYWSITICIAYLCASLVVRFGVQLTPPGRSFDVQWLTTIGVDVAAFSALNFLQSTGLNYTPLLALPVLLAGVLGPLLLALGTAASVTLMLFVDVWLVSLPSHGVLPARLLQSGLSGLGFFAIALLANQLALRLAREKQLARQSQSAARMQAQVSKLVIETLTDGVLVIDIHGVVRSANPASLHLLQENQARCEPPFALTAEIGWQQLAQLAHTTFILSAPQEAGVTLYDRLHSFSRLHVRTRLASSQDSAGENLCVMFLQDLRTAEAQIRTEKMVAMGRMSAAVAHEIRNPLAAISQANALLEEDLHDPAQRQLTTMVRQNAQRLARIVEDVLDISRAQSSDPTDLGANLKLSETVARICTDWAVQADCGPRLQLGSRPANLAAPARPAKQEDYADSVVFDADHLRRIMINLLDNALRHASRSDGAIRVSTRRRESGKPVLTIWSDGPPIEKSVEQHMFEPFFSSESRSSGLGLYICRELCERYGALIDYRREIRDGLEGNAFFVLFQPITPVKTSFFDQL
jgi:two-component system sensor histidine kinase PilS (NtrC family)